jgi:hypothetical protein
MPALDHEKAHQEADKHLFGEEAQKLLEMKTAGCKMLTEITGMSDNDIKNVFKAAQDILTAESTSPPSINFIVADYNKISSGYGYGADLLTPKIRASVEAYVPGKGQSIIMSYDSGLAGFGGRPLYESKPPGVCKESP